MDEKGPPPCLSYSSRPPRARPPRPRRRLFPPGRRGFFIGCVTLTALILTLTAHTTYRGRIPYPNRAPVPSAEERVLVEGPSRPRVALEAHVMSKCPDARDCLQQLVVPAMVRVSNRVDFTLSYIGRYGLFTLSPRPRLCLPTNHHS